MNEVDRRIRHNNNPFDAFGKSPHAYVFHTFILPTSNTTLQVLYSENFELLLVINNFDPPTPLNLSLSSLSSTMAFAFTTRANVECFDDGHPPVSTMDSSMGVREDQEVHFGQA